MEISHQAEAMASFPPQDLHSVDANMNETLLDPNAIAQDESSNSEQVEISLLEDSNEGQSSSCQDSRKEQGPVSPEDSLAPVLTSALSNSSYDNKGMDVQGSLASQNEATNVILRPSYGPSRDVPSLFDDDDDDEEDDHEEGNTEDSSQVHRDNDGEHQDGGSIHPSGSKPDGLSDMQVSKAQKSCAPETTTAKEANTVEAGATQEREKPSSLSSRRRMPVMTNSGTASEHTDLVSRALVSTLAREATHTPSTFGKQHTPIIQPRPSLPSESTAFSVVVPPTSSSPPPNWDGFVRRGTRLKTLLDSAMHHVRDTLTVSMVHHDHHHQADRKRPALFSPAHQEAIHEDHPSGYGPSSGQRPRLMRSDPADFSRHAAELAQEKMIQVLNLQRQLQDAQSHTATLEAANASLREDALATQQQLDRTVEALRVAGSNANKARSDADAAEATAAHLAQTLQSLQTVIEETKRAATVLHQEHEQIATTSTSLEATLLQTQLELGRAQQQVQTLEKAQAEWYQERAQWQQERARLEGLVQNHTQEIQRMQRTLEERDALELARKQRAGQIEQEYRQAQSLLAEATAGQAAAQETIATLDQTVRQLQESHESVHRQCQQQQQETALDRARSSQALAQAEQQGQQWRIQCEAAQEELQRARLDKAALEKGQAALKARILNLEWQLKESVAPIPTPPVEDPAALPTGSGDVGPPITGANGKENDGRKKGVAVGSTCCICFKPAVGIMKACQCGQSHCLIRAHMTCLNRTQPGPSVSHPGTPAPRLPLVLCASSGLATKSRPPGPPTSSPL